MEYISAEEFLKQPEKIQKAFIDYTSKLNDWETSLFSARNEKFRKSKFPLLGSQIDFFVNEYGKDIIPLLTEGQLRKFIEDKINGKIEVVFVDKEGVENEESYYRIERVYYLDGDLKNSVWITGKSDLLQAYWKVALEIAKGCN